MVDSKAIDIASSGMKAQGERLKIIAQNIANADSISTTPGGTPYQRKTISFKSVMDKQIGAEVVKAGKPGTDTTPGERKLDPANPAAGPDGYVQMPNVNMLNELTDMKEAKNAYEANMAVIDLSKSMTARTLDLLR